MVCPVCIIDGIVITACRFFGVPDVVTAFLVGVLTVHLAMLTHRWIKKHDEGVVDKNYALNYYAILFIFIVITLYTLHVVGMW
ncbi:hypothetical protein KAR91_74395 [Candidatus Pacearchaeota archaeon]|nr:hypothetical protein [Candidatus Pacearchaeota archaeon]